MTAPARCQATPPPTRWPRRPCVPAPAWLPSSRPPEAGLPWTSRPCALAWGGLQIAANHPTRSHAHTQTRSSPFAPAPPRSGDAIHLGFLHHRHRHDQAQIARRARVVRRRWRTAACWCRWTTRTQRTAQSPGPARPAIGRALAICALLPTPSHPSLIGAFNRTRGSRGASAADSCPVPMDRSDSPRQCGRTGQDALSRGWRRQPSTRLPFCCTPLHIFQVFQ